MKTINLTFVLLITTLLLSCKSNIQEVKIVFEQQNKQAEFAVNHIAEALSKKQIQVAINEESPNKGDLQIVLFNQADDLSLAKEIGIVDTIEPEGFSIRKIKSKGNTTLYVVGGDAAGTMYGGLELAELVSFGELSKISIIDQKPYMNMRGIKFNIPLDVRTPSYTDMSDAGQMNIEEMWSMDFWTDCIDNLAAHRYNFISLWSLHPFPSMVKVPDYPDIALDDVQRSTTQFEENYDGLGRGYDDPEIINNVEILKKITIDEKIVFWRNVMHYAKERNIDFYIVTWNIFTYGTKNQYGITDKYDNPVTKDYFRKSVKQMLLTYPDLAGIGLTPGENMRMLGTDQKEQWVYDTYGLGMLDAAKEMPGRKMTLVHRQHDTQTKKVAEQFQPLFDHPDINFLFSYKYAKAHVYSHTTQPYHHEFVEDITKNDLKTIWTLRNDDTFYFRWGAPDFVREFISNIPLEVSEGWYLGSDQWIWGREFLSRNPKDTREVEVSKHWYQWMLWGRLGYDPTITNERFQNILHAKYPEIDARKLFVAWQEASMIYPKTTGFHWGMYDFQWYIEGCKARHLRDYNNDGFHDVNFFIDLPPLETTPYLSIPRYSQLVRNKLETDSITPLELALQIHNHANTAMSLLNEFPPVENDDLRRTIKDIRIVSSIGKYYAYKIEGATYLELFRQTDDTIYQNKSIEKLNRAAEQWREYASLALAEYKNPLWTNRVGYVNWRELMTNVLKDVEIAGGVPELRSMSDSPDGTILISNVVDGEISWAFNIEETRDYYAEIKYALDLGEYNSELTVNNSQAQSFVFWSTGGKETYAWDKIRVRLEKGSNEIKLSVPEEANLTIMHLNIIKTK